MIDLHFHSNYSDGIYSPQELVKKAKKFGLTFIALTDHNGIDGLEEFLSQARKEKIKAWPGVEIYTYWRGKHVHLLGYRFALDNKNLQKALKNLQQNHIPKIKKVIKFLKKDGWAIKEKEVFRGNSSYIGLGQIAGALKEHPENWPRLEKDFNQRAATISLTEIVAKYFFKNGRSICPESEISIKEAIKLIKNANGLAILAHPGQQLSRRDESLIREFKKMGLDGIEAISSHHNWDGVEYWQKIAIRLNLLITVGSDFHGDLPLEWRFPVRSVWEYFKVPSSNLKINKIDFSDF